MGLVGGSSLLKFLVSPPNRVHPIMQYYASNLKRNLSGSECLKIDATSSPGAARFRVGTGNPREKDARRKGKKTERERER